MEVEERILENSPIILAILQIRYKLIETSSFDLNELSKINHLLAKTYPQNVKKHTHQVTIKDQNRQKPTATFHEGHLESIMYISEDKQKNFEITNNKITYSQSSKYEGWDKFVLDIKDSWDIIYKRLLKDKIILTGLSIRNVNKIELTEKEINPVDYFNTVIYAKEGVIPDSVNVFSLRYVIPSNKENIHSNVSLSVEPSVGETLPFVFDIDVLYNKETEYNTDDVWTMFNKIRGIKNDIFYKTLTEKTIEIIK